MSTCYEVLAADRINTVKICVDGTSTAEVSTIESEDLTDLDFVWILICAFLVMFMQLGFTLLEAGAVRYKNTLNIMFKNFVDFCLGAIVWYVFGWAITAAPDDEWSNEYWGTGDMMLKNTDDYLHWFFSMVFAATAATIVSGAVAERCTLTAYLCYSFFITAWIYPVVVYWVWSGTGILSQGKEYQLIDFAGSGVVHMVGGFSGLMGSIMIGPRKGNRVPHSVSFQVMGVFILFFGWFGFNCGSTLSARGNMKTAARVAACTTLSAAASGLMSVFLSLKVEGVLSVERMCNGILAGLVSITAGCHVVEAWGAIFIGAIGAIVYYATSHLIIYMGIDDPLDAFAVHGASGVWGVLASAFFGTPTFIRQGGYLFEGAKQSFGEILRNQLCGVLAIGTWTCVFAGFLFGTLAFTKNLRVDDDLEASGLNVKHNSRTTGHWQFHTSFDINPKRRTSFSQEDHHAVRNATMNKISETIDENTV